MKRLYQYLLESLDTKIVKWLQQVYETMQQLIKDNKLQPIDVDVKNLKKPKKPFEFKDFSENKIVKQIVSDKVIGFTVTNQMLQMPKKYLVDKINNEEKELSPKCLPYWYQDGSNIYFIGIIMYDTSINYVNDFVHLIGIETSLCVKEATPVLKAMLNDWALHEINKEGNYKGITAKPMHPKMKAILTKLGFNTFKDNKEILTYKL